MPVLFFKQADKYRFQSVQRISNRFRQPFACGCGPRLDRHEKRFWPSAFRDHLEQQIQISRMSGNAILFYIRKIDQRDLSGVGIEICRIHDQNHICPRRFNLGNAILRNISSVQQWDIHLLLKSFNQIRPHAIISARTITYSQDENVFIFNTHVKFIKHRLLFYVETREKQFTNLIGCFRAYTLRDSFLKSFLDTDSTDASRADSHG